MKKFLAFIKELANVGSWFIMIWLVLTAGLEWRWPGVVVTAIPAGIIVALVLAIISIDVLVRD